jgi:proteasome lid subunit RPN8/RPN11
MIAALILPEALRAQLAAEARAALPNECCGLIEGAHDGEPRGVSALHPTKNLSTAPDRFEIDPVEHIRVLRALRGTGRGIIGCYHSHPNGRAEPSERDRASAFEDGFVWLIQPVTETGAGTPAAFVIRNGAFRPLVLTA